MNKNKMWVYTGSDDCLDFNDIPIPENEKANIPSYLKPTIEMQERFCKECEKLGIMKQVKIVELVCVNGVCLEK